MAGRTMKKFRAYMFLGVIVVMLMPLLFYSLNLANNTINTRDLDGTRIIPSSEMKMISNITLILNYNDGQNVTYTNLTLMGDISAYNATVFAIGKENIDEYWAINGVFIKGMKINEIWYINGNGGRNWLYYVNGIFAGVSSSVVRLLNNSIVEWKFVAGNPYPDPDPDGDFWVYTGIIIGVAAVCVVGIIFIVKRGI